MNITSLLLETGRYLESYLEAFVEEGKEEHLIPTVHHGIQIPPSTVRLFDEEDVQIDDRHKSRFQEFYSVLPKATTRDFIEAVSKIDDLVVVDIASMSFGAEFGLWVANTNPSAEVHVYNPEPDIFFPPFLFNNINACKIFKFKKNLPLYINDVEGSVNRLYGENGLDNITFHQEAVGLGSLETLARTNMHRRVLFFSKRVPTVPQDLTPIIAQVVGRNKNTEMVLAPFVDRIGGYDNDPLIALINKHIGIREGQPRDKITQPLENARARLFVAISQYDALKAAQIAGAKVYRECDFETGFPFHQPTHYVSTIDLNRFS